MTATSAVSSTLLQNVSASATPGGLPKNQTVDQAQFLKLFVAQLQHQDPLSPLEPDQLTAQLAQFSSLEQLTGVNERLDKLADAQKGNTGSALLALLGKEIAFDGGSLDLKAGKAPPVTYTVKNAADKVTATVRAEDGSAVRVLELGAQGAGEHEFTFDGRDSLGSTLPDGKYTLEIAASVAGQKTATPLSLVTRAKVDGVDLAADPPALLVGDRRIALDQVQVVHGSAS